MTTTQTAKMGVDEPGPSGDVETVVIRPRSGWVPIDLRELWRYRELLWIFALRDIQVRYKQSVLGISWAVIQPVTQMVVFTLLFGALLGRGNQPAPAGVPYAVSTLAALVPWQLFSTALSRGGISLVSNQHIITKIYFPRLIMPAAPTLAALIDFAIAFVVLMAMMAWYGIVPGWQVLALPLMIGLAAATAMAVSMWLAALNAIYRDVQHIIPFLVQVWMFVSPVVYDTQSVLGEAPQWARVVYGLNPMAGVIEGFRWALLGTTQPPSMVMIPSAMVVLVLLVSGMYFFRRMERTFADLV